MTRPGEVLFVAAAVFSSLAACSCGGKGKEEEGTGRIFPVSSTVTKGPLEAVVSLSARRISLADTVTFRVELRLERAYSAEIRDGDLLAGKGFTVRDIRDDESSDAARVYIRREYVLEPLSSGTLTVPPVVVTFGREDGKERYTCRTDSLSCTVSGLSEGERKKLVPADIDGPRPIGGGGRRWWLVPVVLLVLGAGGGAAFLVRRRTNPVEEESAVSPRRRAMERLKTLGEKGYIGKGLYEEFYYEITWIMRVFISEVFGIEAPRRTTEEFLRELGKRKDFPDAYKKTLAHYLERCDRVKYARHRPSYEDVQEIFDMTRDFIASAGPEPRE